MCDVPSTAAFCNESIEYFPGMVFNFFFKPFVTFTVVSFITGIIVRLIFYILSISIHKLLYFSFFIIIIIIIIIIANGGTSNSISGSSSSSCFMSHSDYRCNRTKEKICCKFLLCFQL